MFAETPKPPYYAVIFTAVRTEVDQDYAATSKLMRELASRIDGYLGIETAGEGEEITISYWRDLEAIREWKENTEHQIAKSRGRKDWYQRYISRIAKVEREYGYGES